MKKIKEWIEWYSPEILGYSVMIGLAVLSITFLIWSIKLLITVVGGML